MKWFFVLALIAIGILGIFYIAPYPIPAYASTINAIIRILGSIIWAVIFGGATIYAIYK